MNKNIIIGLLIILALIGLGLFFSFKNNEVVGYPPQISSTT